MDEHRLRLLETRVLSCILESKKEAVLRKGKLVQISGAHDGLEEGLGPNCVSYVLVFLGSFSICQLYKLPLSDQTQVILQLRVSLSDEVSRFLACPPLLGKPKKFFAGA
jgi:hypothetical protein